MSPPFFLCATEIFFVPAVGFGKRPVENEDPPGCGALMLWFDMRQAKHRECVEDAGPRVCDMGAIEMTDVVLGIIGGSGLYDLLDLRIASGYLSRAMGGCAFR